MIYSMSSMFTILCLLPFFSFVVAGNTSEHVLKRGMSELSQFTKSIILSPPEEQEHQLSVANSVANNEEGSYEEKNDQRSLSNPAQKCLNLMMISCEDTYPYGPSENTAVSE